VAASARYARSGEHGSQASRVGHLERYRPAPEQRCWRESVGLPGEDSSSPGARRGKTKEGGAPGRGRVRRIERRSAPIRELSSLSTNRCSTRRCSAEAPRGPERLRFTNEDHGLRPAAPLGDAADASPDLPGRPESSRFEACVLGVVPGSLFEGFGSGPV